MKMLRSIEVVAALIREGDKILAAQRGYGEYKDFWEFPGGKIEPGETPEAALKREIKEELATEIEINEYVGTVDYDYPDFHITLLLYLCTMVSGNLELLEHESAKWLLASELDSVSWLPADLEIIPKLKSLLALN